tara:strand:- start:305 stop:697 length:393 start_codon:yes stop_codon:yes gene_type:complete
MIKNQLRIMTNKSDVSFEYSRVLQLLEQFSLYGCAEFTIVFGTITKDAEYSTWSTPDDDFKKYKESGFFELMQHLLSIFVEYKSQHILLKHCHAIIQITQHDIAIEWVSKKIAENAITSIHETEKNNVNK